MDLNGASNQPNTRIQPSIRSFFQPRTPQYTAPPAPPTSQTSLTAPSKPTFASPAVLSSPAALNLVSPPATKSTAEELQYSITPISEQHIQPLRRINALLLPISYPDSFYSKILSPSPPASTNLSRVILWHDTSSTAKVIGGIVVRLDPSLSPSSTPQNQQYIEGSYDVYIQSLALLSPYRGKGLASQALEEVIKAALDIGRGGGSVRIRDLYAHAWTESEEALEWYQKRGFRREGEVVEGYYRRLRPDGAWLLRRRVGVEDHLAHSSNMSPTLNGVPEALVTRNGEQRQTRSVDVKENKRPGLGPVPTKSFQDRRPANEWNDLPEDVLRNVNEGVGGLKPPSLGSSAASSRSSSRSGLDGRGKKKRQYPAAAFGS